MSNSRAASNRTAESIVVPRVPFLRHLRNGGPWVVLALILAWSWKPAEMGRSIDLVTDWRNMAEFGSAFLRPNFHDWELYLSEMIVTIQIAAWGTALAVLVGVPCAILSASNICSQWIVQPMRRLMDTLRAINELVFGLLFVVAVGLGPFAGVMALFVHNTGIIAKLFSEQLEAADSRPAEGIRATGASRLYEVEFGLIPQVMPLWISVALYRFEANLRSATVLGIIGAGGIGQTIYESIRSFYYSETAAIIIIMVVAVIIVDIISAQLRRFLVHSS